MEIVGSIVAKGNTTNNNVTSVTFTLQLAAGGQPIDLNKTLITVLVPVDGTFKELSYQANSSILDDKTEYLVKWIYALQTPPDNYLEEFEKAEVTVYLEAAGFDVDPNDNFIIEVKPPIGAAYPIELKAPPSIDEVMVLLR